MGTGQCVAGGLRNRLYIGISHAMHVVLDTLVGRCKHRVLQQTGRAVGAVGGQHGEVRCALQYFHKIAEQLWTLLKELGCRQLVGRIIILRHIIVIVDTGGQENEE